MGNNGKKSLDSIKHKLRFKDYTTFTINGTKWKIEKKGNDCLIIQINGVHYGRYVNNTIIENFSEIDSVYEYFINKGLFY